MIDDQIGIGRVALSHCHARSRGRQGGGDGCFRAAAVVFNRDIQVNAFVAIDDAVAIAARGGVVNGDRARIELGDAGHAKVLCDRAAADGADRRRDRRSGSAVAVGIGGANSVASGRDENRINTGSIRCCGEAIAKGHDYSRNRSACGARGDGAGNRSPGGGVGAAGEPVRCYAGGPVEGAGRL